MAARRIAATPAPPKGSILNPPSSPLLRSLLQQAEQDPLLEMFLLTAIDRYAESLADLDQDTLRKQVLQDSPRQSSVGIDAAAWQARARQVRALLRQAYDS